MEPPSVTSLPSDPRRSALRSNSWREPRFRGCSGHPASDFKSVIKVSFAASMPMQFTARGYRGLRPHSFEPHPSTLQAVKPSVQSSQSNVARAASNSRGQPRAEGGH